MSFPILGKPNKGRLGFVWFAASFVRQMAEDPMQKTAILNITFNKRVIIQGDWMKGNLRYYVDQERDVMPRYYVDKEKLTKEGNSLHNQRESRRVGGTLALGSETHVLVPKYESRLVI